MKLSFLITNLLGLLIIAAAVAMSANDPGQFLNLPGLLIVLGGTAAALFASYPMKEVQQAWRQLWTLLETPTVEDHQLIQNLGEYARLWSRHDLKGIEKRLLTEPNRLLQSGLQLMLARMPAADVISALAWRIKRFKAQEQASARLFHSLAAYAPAFGMVGTLIGLVNLLFSMQSDNASSEILGFNWAVALVTTFYGLLLANLVFKPIATKLERRTEHHILEMSLVLEGISLMAQGRSPAFVRENLQAFLGHEAVPARIRETTPPTLTQTL